MDRFTKAVGLVSQLCGFVAGTLIALGVIIVCQMVFVRFVLNENTIWQTDFVTYCLVAATFIGSPYVLMAGGHVNVDVVPLHVGAKARYRLAVFAAVLSLIFTTVMTVLTFQFWLQSWTEGWTSDTMWRARLWIPYGAMPIGLGILTLQYVATLVNLITGRALPFGIKEDDAA